MLVLKRKPNEKIRIGSDIVISVIAVSEHQVKIGIEAPDDVKILREEIYESVKQSIIEASKSSIEVPEKIPAIKKVNKNSD